MGVHFHSEEADECRKSTESVKCCRSQRLNGRNVLNINFKSLGSQINLKDQYDYILFNSFSNLHLK